MVAYVEVIICLAALAGSIKWAATEYERIRKDRQMRHALQLALAEMA